MHDYIIITFTGGAGKGIMVTQSPVFATVSTVESRLLVFFLHVSDCYPYDLHVSDWYPYESQWCGISRKLKTGLGNFRKFPRNFFVSISMETGPRSLKQDWHGRRSGFGGSLGAQAAAQRHMGECLISLLSPAPEYWFT